ncbi:MAG: hypothetical protein ABR524_02225 [Thermoanaerobaculia bacterium]
MKKFLTLTGLMLLVAATAMAGVGDDRLFVQPNATFATGSPTTTNNDDSCDIALQPAATLLLPYFEVEVNEPRTTAKDTNFTIINTSRLPQIAHITLWTDWSFPVIDFNIFLTGYDVQAISLYDIIVRGQIPSTTSAKTPGSLSAANTTAANPSLTSVAGCTQLPGPIPGDLASAIRSALTVGTYPGFGCVVAVGGNHPDIATGYATIDVARFCGTGLPTETAYFANEIGFDNVLTGDYMYINPDAASGNFAGGTPLVHIRAVPEGLGAPAPYNLPFTFYDRYNAGGVDRRQPLPGTFAARYIAAGAETFDTDFQVWREGLEDPDCTGLGNPSGNANIEFTEFVRFDEQENPMTRQGGVIVSPAPVEGGTEEAFSASINDALFPGDFTGTADLGGWMYMDLNNGGAPGFGYAATRPAGRSQNWVTVSMSAEGRYSVLFDATALGNGCSAAPLSGDPIGPAVNVTP